MAIHLRQRLFLAVIALFLTGCTAKGISTSSPTFSAIPPTYTVIPTRTAPPYPTNTRTPVSSVTPAPTKTTSPSVTRTESPSSTPTPKQGLIWANDIEPIIIPDHNWYYQRNIWSPTANEILYACVSSIEICNNIVKIAAPKFTPEIIATPDICDDVIWAPDGRILYVQWPDEIWVINSDGSQPRLATQASERDIRFEGWLGNDNLIYSNYAGGGHSVNIIVNISTGKELAWATIHGSINTPNANYVPATYDTGEFDYHLLVITVDPKGPFSSSVFDPTGNVTLIPDFDSVPITQTTTTFEGWVPGMNQILVAWKKYIPNNYFYDQIEEEHLLIWDVDSNQLSFLVPNSFTGIISPDDRYLAYETYGPAKLDDRGKPIKEYRPRNLSEWENWPAQYIQLFDISDKRVTMSLPILPHIGNANFSPDGHYLAFLTPGNLSLEIPN